MILAAPPPRPARVQIVAREFSFALSRPVLKAGPVIVELVNFGQDPHDLKLQRIGSGQVQELGLVGPGRRVDLITRLAPGRYRLWCSLADHDALGMHAVLVVRR